LSRGGRATTSPSSTPVEPALDTRGEALRGAGESAALAAVAVRGVAGLVERIEAAPEEVVLAPRRES